MTRIVWAALGFLLSIGAAHADKVVVSGKPLMLYQASSTNPDCSSAGNVVLRVAQAPQHGRVTIRQTSLFPKFSEANPRSACNRRRVAGVEATYVSRRGHLGPDFVVLEAFFPTGRALKLRFPIRVM